MTAIRCGICLTGTDVAEGSVSVYGNSRSGVVIVLDGADGHGTVVHACGPGTEQPQPFGASRQERRKAARAKTPKDARRAQRDLSRAGAAAVFGEPFHEG